MIVGWLELSFIFFAFYRHSSGDWFLWILFVVRELCNSFVVTFLRWMRWFKGLIMLYGGSSLGFWYSMGDCYIFLENFSMSIKGIGLFSSLGERLILKHRVMVLSFLPCKLLRSVIIVFHVGYRSAKGNLLANLTFLDRVGANVRWL